MKILHTESSNGWGGQEIRIISEAEGLHKRGHEIVFAAAKDGGLAKEAKKRGFAVYEIVYKKWAALRMVAQIFSIIGKEKIDIVNTHSSLDSWVGGIAAKLKNKPVVRTRHLSTPTRAGANSRLLYRHLADFVVTTSSNIIPAICQNAGIPSSRCRMIATGVDTDSGEISPDEVDQFRRHLGLLTTDILVGTVCVVRSWKGVLDLIEAAHLLRDVPHIRWVIVGGGYLDGPQARVKELGLSHLITFTGHMPKPQVAAAAIDIFLLLSTANEGISQAALQAAALGKPLVTTTIGGLPEVCIDKKTGLLVAPKNPREVADAVLALANDPQMRVRLGKQGQALVQQKFTLKHTLDQMEEVFTTTLKDSI